ncbi:MAG: cysteine desulfurase [Bacteroidetes bacterium HGW-Bacteroidetes-7]|nr:MAG: cysteine desulfurase [Bacteroidetes bacterium HGW-Bacteroidetes-7]
MSDIETIRSLFPALEQTVNSRKLVYLDNGATAQKPKQVIDMVNLMNSGVNGNIHRAVHELSSKTTELYEESREVTRKFMNAAQREEIIFTSGTTASINLVAVCYGGKHLKKGDSVLISEAEHHSNIVPWQMICQSKEANLRVIPVDENGHWRMDMLDNLLDSSVKIVSVSHISNVLGLINPVEELIFKAHAKGIPVLIDGAQSIVHIETDVRKLDCDFYVFSGHKLYGPTGTGVLYGKREILDSMPPWMGGGDMVDTVTLEKTTYAPLPLKFEAGTPNFIGAAAMAEAIRFVESIDRKLLDKMEQSIVDYMTEELLKIDGLRLYGRGDSRISLFSFTVNGAHPSDLAMIMDKMGVALRSGQMCAEPLMRRFGVEAMLRASFAAYNTIEEAEYFIASLKRAIKMLS